MNLLCRIALLSLLLTFSNTACSQPLDLDAVLEQLIDSYGGESNLRKMQSQVQEWEMIAVRSHRRGTDIRTIRALDQLKVELTYPDKTETRIFDGEESYIRFNRGPTKPVVEAQRDAMRLQLMRLYSPLLLRDKRDSLTMTTKGATYLLSLFEHVVSVDYVVNAENWRIEKVVGTLPIKGSTMQFLAEYSDFTMRDGVLIHQREKKYAGGVSTAVLQLREITLDADLKDANFLADGETI